MFTMPDFSKNFVATIVLIAISLFVVFLLIFPTIMGVWDWIHGVEPGGYGVA